MKRDRETNLARSMKYCPAGGASKLQRNIAGPTAAAIVSELLQPPLQRHVKDRHVKIEICVNKSLLKEFDKFCSENAKTRHELTGRAWKALMNAAQSELYQDLRAAKEASKR